MSSQPPVHWAVAYILCFPTAEASFRPCRIVLGHFPGPSLQTEDPSLVWGSKGARVPAPRLAQSCL